MHVCARQVQVDGHLLQSASRLRSLTSHMSFGAALTTALRQYYTGEAVAPYPTIFVGGNHEASNHLWEVREVDSTELSHSVHIAHSPPPLCAMP